MQNWLLPLVAWYFCLFVVAAGGCQDWTSHESVTNVGETKTASMPCSEGMMEPARSNRGCDGWCGGICQLKLTHLMNGNCVPWSPTSGLLNHWWRVSGGAISHPDGWKTKGGVSMLPRALKTPGFRRYWAAQGWDGGRSHPP